MQRGSRLRYEKHLWRCFRSYNGIFLGLKERYHSRRRAPRLPAGRPSAAPVVLGEEGEASLDARARPSFSVS